MFSDVQVSNQVSVSIAICKFPYSKRVRLKKAQIFNLLLVIRDFLNPEVGHFTNVLKLFQLQNRDVSYSVVSLFRERTELITG